MRISVSGGGPAVCGRRARRAGGRCSGSTPAATASSTTRYALRDDGKAIAYITTDGATSRDAAPRRRRRQRRQGRRRAGRRPRRRLAVADARARRPRPRTARRRRKAFTAAGPDKARPHRAVRPTRLRHRRRQARAGHLHAQREARRRARARRLCRRHAASRSRSKTLARGLPRGRSSKAPRRSSRCGGPTDSPCSPPCAPASSTRRATCAGPIATRGSMSSAARCSPRARCRTCSASRKSALFRRDHPNQPVIVHFSDDRKKLLCSTASASTSSRCRGQLWKYDRDDARLADARRQARRDVADRRSGQPRRGQSQEGRPRRHRPVQGRSADARRDAAVARCPGEGRRSSWQIAGNALVLLRKGKGFDRGGVALEVYDVPASPRRQAVRRGRTPVDSHATYKVASAIATRAARATASLRRRPIASARRNRRRRIALSRERRACARAFSTQPCRYGRAVITRRSSRISPRINAVRSHRTRDPNTGCHLRSTPPGRRMQTREYAYAQFGTQRALAAVVLAKVQSAAVLGVEAYGVCAEVDVADGSARLSPRRARRQRGQRRRRARARGARSLGLEDPAAQGDHQPRAGRRAQGRRRVRSADRGRRAGRAGDRAARGARRHTDDGGAVARRHACGASPAACRSRCTRERAARARSSCRALAPPRRRRFREVPVLAAASLPEVAAYLRGEHAAAACRRAAAAGAQRRRRRRSRGRARARVRQARARGRRRRLAQPAAHRRARIGQEHDRAPAADDLAAARRGRGAADEHDLLGGRQARRRVAHAAAAVSRAASGRLAGGPRRRRRRRCRSPARSASRTTACSFSTSCRS